MIAPTISIADILVDILATMFALVLALSLAFRVYLIIATDEEDDDSYPTFTPIPHSGAYDRVSKPMTSKPVTMSKKKIDAIAFDRELFRKHAKNSAFRSIHQQREAALKAALKVRKPQAPITPIATPIEPQLLTPFGLYRDPCDEFDIDDNEDEETKELLNETQVTKPSSTQLFPNLKPATFAPAAIIHPTIFEETKEENEPHPIIVPAKSYQAREKKRLLEEWFFQNKKNGSKDKSTDSSDEETTTTSSDSSDKETTATTTNEETITEKKKTKTKTKTKKLLRKLNKKIRKVFQKKQNEKKKTKTKRNKKKKTKQNKKKKTKQKETTASC